MNEDDLDLLSDAPSIPEINWYPGHMARAVREIKEKLKLVDIVLEIRDARAPLAFANKAMDESLRQKKRIIVFNKVNLASSNSITKWDQWFKAQNEYYLFLDCFDKSSIKKVMSMARNLVGPKKNKLRIMILGLPNTGKSTIINQIANRNASKTADRPGQTTGQQWISIDDTLELLDTPGVMPPFLNSVEHGLWLSALHAIPDEIVGEEKPALFLVQFFKERNSSDFLTRYKLDNLDGEIDEILLSIAKIRGCLQSGGRPDLDRVYKLILLDFRKGLLGKVCFELPPKN